MDFEPILSRDEIETLLSSVRSDAPLSSPEPRPVKTQEPAKSSGDIVPWDFRRPRTLCRADLRRIQDRHRETTDAIARVLAGVLRSPAQVRVLPPGESTASEFLEARPETALVARSGDLFVDFSPAVAFGLVERILGAGRTSRPPERALRPLEGDLLAPLVGRLLEALGAVWAPAPAAPICWGMRSLLAAESLPEGSMVVLGLEILSEGILGDLVVAVPASRCDPQASRPAARGPAPAPGVAIEASVRFPLGRIRLGDVERIAPGDLLIWRGSSSPPVTVDVGGNPRYAGRPGLLGDRLAVEVLRPAGPEPHPVAVDRRSGGEAPSGPPVEVPVEIRAVAAARAISLRELSELRPGAILAFGRPVEAPVEIRLRNRPVAQGRAVRVGDQLGVQIE